MLEFCNKRIQCVNGELWVTLAQEDFEKCLEFSVKSAHTQQEIEFGQEDTKKRSVLEIARDNLIGKMAEFAYRDFLLEFSSKLLPGCKNPEQSIAVDLNIYPVGVYDDQDIAVNGWRIDVKSARSGAKWFLLEFSKLQFRAREEKLAPLYFIGQTNWKRNLDSAELSKHNESDEVIKNKIRAAVGDERSVRLCGYIELDTILDESRQRIFSSSESIADKNIVYIFAKGSNLPTSNSNGMLQADNFGVPICNLSTDWDGLFNKLSEKCEWHCDADNVLNILRLKIRKLRGRI